MSQSPAPVDESKTPSSAQTQSRLLAADHGLNMPAIIATVVWSGVYPAVKITLEGLSPVTLSLFRLLGTSLILFLVIWLPKRRLRLPSRSDLPLLFFVGLAFAANRSIFAMALDYLTASHTVLLYGASPMLTIVVAWLVGQERPRLRTIGGVTVSLAGIALIVSRGDDALSPDVLLGDLLAFIAMVSWVMTTVAAVPLLRRLSPLEELAYAWGIGFVLTIPIAWQDATNTDYAAVSLSAWLALAFIIIIGDVFGTILWNLGIRQVGATRTMLFFNLQPIVGVLFSVALLGETIVPLQLAGAAIVIIGILIARR